MALEKSELIDLYRQRARGYDLTANLYYLLGFREWAYRRRAVEALGLGPGDTVVEIGCGTGLNFSLLQEEIGQEGRIVGVDVTDAMLAEAEERVQAEGWANVKLVHSDAAAYQFPEDLGGILSTFALTLVPEYDQVVARGADRLRPGARWVVADLKLPESGWQRMLLPLLLPLFRPFGVTLDLAGRHPWLSLPRHLDGFGMEERYFGYTYVAWGEKRDSGPGLAPR